ncbi:MAG: succinate dehydrogenase assembly factor 2 [Thermohalobaculum sp.]|nr:succinate dehydrogenase assembly factor 2 [Thermohalobaculum sp.]
MTEPRETRLKRLKIRSWRRGTREMDLILGPFADTELARLGEAELAAYEALLEENDQDLYAWVSGTAEAGAPHGPLVARIAAWHQIG